MIAHFLQTFDLLIIDICLEFKIRISNQINNIGFEIDCSKRNVG